MQEEEKSEGCVSTKASEGEEWETETGRGRASRASRAIPGTKISLLICALWRQGSGCKVREQGLDFLLHRVEENEKLNKCSYMKKNTASLEGTKSPDPQAARQPLASPWVPLRADINPTRTQGWPARGPTNTEQPMATRT